ncbi:MAG: acyl-CoA/acyl-ACP dehydrogenase [Chloroflexi bacterium]|nr:acyl-CoA/acyl-ACP dehydrogenase [Chloroflexota bacterium]
MDLSLNEMEQLVKNTARDFAERECPIEIVRGLDESESGFSPQIWQKMAEMGWAGMILPEKYGGSGASLTALGVLCEELGRAIVPSPLHSSSVLCGLAILEGGTDKQKETLLPAVAAGERILALAFTEAGYGWDAASVHMSATPRNSRFILNGTKVFVHDALVADQILCVARTSQSQNAEDGITLFLVDKQSPGVNCYSLPGFAGEKFCEVSFDKVEVPEANVVGEVGKGWAILQPVLEKGTVVLCAYMVGGCHRIWESTLEYCRTRVQFGVPIGNFQRVQDHVIDIVNALDAARWTTYEALWKIDNGKPEVSKAVSLAKAVTSEAYHQACNSSHEVHAGTGLSKEYHLYLYTKKARTFYHYLGSPSYHRQRLAELLEL